MPKNEVSDLITDQEMVFARLVLSGTMNDRAAAQAAGLNPDTAAYTKAKPRVRAYMIEHRAAMQQQHLQQENDLRRRRDLRREQVLDRLWELAALGPETTRGSITGQVKAMSMIVAIEGLVPDRRAGSAAKESAPPPPATTPGAVVDPGQSAFVNHLSPSATSWAPEAFDKAPLPAAAEQNKNGNPHTHY